MPPALKLPCPPGTSPKPRGSSSNRAPPHEVAAPAMLMPMGVEVMMKLMKGGDVEADDDTDGCGG